MVYTKEEFKRLWGADNDAGITNDDCADCAKAWGLCSNPRTESIDHVVDMVLVAAGISEKAQDVPTADDMWRIYHFIEDYKHGVFGFTSLQTAIDNYFPTYER